MASRRYDHRQVEKKWQEVWGREGLYDTDLDSAKKPFYNLWMYPYPSAEGLHAGHAFSSTGSDIIGRYMRMKGKDVFQPIGYDSFGIHSENYALKMGEHPSKMLARTIKNYERQLRSLGHGYDWKHTVTVSEIDYYRWTQWLFVQLFKAGLAYRKAAKVNWCPSCKTVLADEQVIDNKCERCGTEVVKKELEQWFFRITDYADRLLGNLEKIDWSHRVKVAQRNWIGRKEGITINYSILPTSLALRRASNSQFTISCFTTRPDTNFGATFVVVSPEYAKENLLELLEKGRRIEVEEYIGRSLGKSEQQRQEEGREKSGVFTGLRVVNELNGREMPVWVSDFVLMGYGTGAVVGVPGHDKRDFEFAEKFELPIVRVVVGPDGDESEIVSVEQVWDEGGKMVNSEFLDGMGMEEAIGVMMEYLEEKGWGVREVNYHLRDWLISRQRYWGPPIPMVYCKSCAERGESFFTLKGETFKGVRKDQTNWKHAGWYPVPEEELPVELPQIEDYKPEGTGKGPLAKHPEFYETKCPKCGGKARRETDVSDTFLDSSWYFLRYPSVGSKTSEKFPFDSEITKKWLPVDLYFGGAEHSVLHLMYARFVTQVLFDLKKIDFEEPFPRFYAHGLMIKDGAKMSKSRGNVVNPDDYIEKYGADTLRMYLAFMGPMDANPDFRDAGIEGMGRYLQRVWELCCSSAPLMSEATAKELGKCVNKTIQKVTEDMRLFKFNTAISATMELVNKMRDIVGSGSEGGRDEGVWRGSLGVLVRLLAPIAPHMTEELWRGVLGSKESVHLSDWPEYDPDSLRESDVTVVVQINGKVRAQLEMGVEDAKDKNKVLERAKAEPNVAKWLEKAELIDVFFVQGRLVNFVVGGK